MWQQVQDIDTLAQIRVNQDPDWITIVLRCMGEMEGDQSIPPDPTKELDRPQRRDRRAPTAPGLRQPHDDSGRRDALAGDGPGRLRPRRRPGRGSATGGQAGEPRVPAEPQRPVRRLPATAVGHPAQLVAGWGTRNHTPRSRHDVHGRAGCILVTDARGRFHGLSNAYVVGPAIFPTLGSANPALTALALARLMVQLLVQDRTATPVRRDSSRCPVTPPTGRWWGVPGASPRCGARGRCWRPGTGYGLNHHVKEEFADASFWIEWRELAAGDNSGVYVRTPGPSGPDPLEQARRAGDSKSSNRTHWERAFHLAGPYMPRELSTDCVPRPDPRPTRQGCGTRSSSRPRDPRSRSPSMGSRSTTTPAPGGRRGSSPLQVHGRPRAGSSSQPVRETRPAVGLTGGVRGRLAGIASTGGTPPAAPSRSRRCPRGACLADA